MDNNLYSIWNERPIGQVKHGQIIAHPGIADALHVSDSADGEIYIERVVGGDEDCCDCNNHCENISIHADLWEPRGKYLATIKGACRNITLTGEVIGHGTEVDVDLGNISDQSDDRTGPVKLSLRHRYGEPITVRVLHASRPIILNPHEQHYEIVCELPRPVAKLWTKAVKFFRKYF